MFFRDPKEEPITPGDFSTLYLLRRDIVTCLGRNPTTMERINCQALWPAAMAIFAGIDLLAKFHNGDKGKSGERFKYFINYFLILDNDKAEILYQLRNSLVHSFGLYSEKSDTKVYRFTLINNDLSKDISINTKEDCYTVNINALNDLFNSYINLYCNHVRRLENLSIFNAMFEKYGGPIHID